MMPRFASVLLADTDVDFREAMVNLFLLSGVSDLTEADSEDSAVYSLSRGGFDLVMMDRALYERPKVRSLVDIQRKTRGAAIVVVLDDRLVTPGPWDSWRGEGVLCVVRSAAERTLSGWTALSPPGSTHER